MMCKMKGSELLVKALEHEGVKRVFGVPGEEILQVLESLRVSKIEFVLTRHEHGAAFMAATLGRLTGCPGVCIVTCGPGALNVVSAAAYAQLNALPILIITGQKPIMSSRQARFQLVDVISTMKPVTKASLRITSAASIPTMIREAWRLATEERPGPVHLELPEDVAAEEIEPLAMVPAHPIEIPVAHPAALDRAANIILRAKRPLIMAGAAANRPRLAQSGALADFVRRTGIPFFTTQMGMGAVSGCRALYIGTAAISEDDDVHEAIHQSDLIIAIGHDIAEKPPFVMQPTGPRVIHVNYTQAPVEQVYFPCAEIVGDVGPSLKLLADRLEGKLSNAKALLWVRDRIQARVAERAMESCWPVTPERLAHDIRKVMPEDGIVALDNGMYKLVLARTYPTHTPNTLLLDNTLATMGAGLPSAIAIALQCPDSQVMALCGDGGFMMSAHELETAVRLKINLVVVILNDGAYGMIRCKQAGHGFPPFGVAFGNPEFVRYAESFGAKGFLVRCIDELVPTLEAAFKDGGVHVVEVPINYSKGPRVREEQ